MASIIPVAPPRLPTSPAQFDRRYQDTFLDVLRLYFSRLGGNVNTLVGTNGGKFISFPYAAIQRTTDKTFTANTATEITFDQNDYLSGCSNNGTDGIVVDQPGIYNYQFSIQFANTDTQIHTAWVWLRVNGVDLAGTGSKFDCAAKHGSSDGYLIAACNFYVSLNAGDAVSLYAAVSNAALYSEAYAVQTSPFVMPAIPSVVATLSFVSSTPA